MAVLCPSCEATVLCLPRGWAFDNFDMRDGIPERWTLLQCPIGHVLLVLQEIYHANMTFNEDSPYRLYPPQDRQLSLEIPVALRETHEEARKCLHVKAFTAAVAMSGRTLEGACALNGVHGKTLQISLKEMKDRAFIDGRLWEWAETLRSVRNSAAHFTGGGGIEITRQDAEDALAFSEALLDYLYVLSARFDALKKRRAKPQAVDATGRGS